jgi:hypothetical protein
MPGDVLGRNLHRGRHRAIVAQELLDGTVEVLGMRLQEGRLRGMPERAAVALGRPTMSLV